eukprot:14591263-Ditylum_brightwellii.AAC.1
MYLMVKKKNYFRSAYLLKATRLPPQIMKQYKKTILSSVKVQASNIEEYSHGKAKIIGIVMSHYSQVMDGMASSKAYAFIQIYVLKK